MQGGDKFTERVRKVMYLAREEAARLHHDYIGTEHLLLGILREGEGIAAMSDALALDSPEWRQLGGDLYFTGRIVRG